MIKTIRNLLISFVPFLPLEKAQGNDTEGQSQEETANFEGNRDSLNKILEGDYNYSLPKACVNQVTDLLNLIAEAESNGWEFAESEKSTNVLENIELDEVDYLTLSPNTDTFLNEKDGTENGDQLPSVDPVENGDDQIMVSEIPSVENISSFDNVNLTTNTPNEAVFVQELESKSEINTNIASVVDLPNVGTNEVISAKEPKENLDAETISVINSTDTVTNELVSVQEPKESTETNDIPMDIVVNTEPSLISDDHRQTDNPLNFEENISENHEIPTTGNMGKFFDWLLIGLSAVGVSGILGKLVYTYSKSQRRNKKMHVSENFEDCSIPPTLQQKQPPTETIPPKQEQKTSLPPPKKEKDSSKRKSRIEMPVIELDENSHQKGVKMLANIKLRRSAINRQMKALRAEIVQHHQSEPRFLEIANEMAALQEERNQLTREHRIARTLVKGKEGERIQEERRLIAKEIRLIKKTNDNNIERIRAVMNKRANLLAQDKALLKTAENEAKERLETANWWRGKRLYQEAITLEKQLNERISQLKKATGLKKTEILELEDDIREEVKKLRHQKSLAIRQMKGTKFTKQKRVLSKKIIEAHQVQNLSTESQLKEELQKVKAKEKEYIKWAKSFDYVEGRRSVAPASVKMHAERRDKANAWKGYRMLRDLNQELVSSVKNQQISKEAYQAQAHSLIGKQYDPAFNYETERAAALKPATLASIYLSHKKQGII